MLIYALLALALGAVAGIFLAFRHFVRQRLPVWVALAHGVGGATGFTLVLLTVVRQPTFGLARQALYLLIATIALGCVNLLFHVRKVRHRTSLIVMHALCAVSGVLTIVYALFVGAPATSVAATAPAPPSPPSSTESALDDTPAPAPVPTAVASASATATPAPEGSASAAVASPEPPAPSGAGGSSLDPGVKQALSSSFAFASNSSRLAEESMSGLRAIAKALADHPELTLVEVQGHADGRGGDGHNLALTRERAAAVMAALVALGVQPTRLRSAGYGARCPLDPACGVAGAPESCLEVKKLRADRRVVVVPIKLGTAALPGPVACERGADLVPP